MKTVFVVNPKAGGGKKFDSIIETLEGLKAKFKGMVDYHVTTAPREARTFVSEYCKSEGVARFIACGGDGTLNEVLNSAVEFDGNEVGVVPIGTGNDFCRNFPSDVDFNDLEGQVLGSSVRCDAIKYHTETGGGTVSGYAANMFNIGFDCAVADMTDTVRDKTVISGPFAYLASIFINLAQKRTTRLKVDIDGEEYFTGELLLTSVANGCFCGGGLKTNPIAQINDGLINVNVVKNVTRTKFLSLLPSYIKGECLGKPGIDKILKSLKCKSVRISPLDGRMRISVDGEITDAGVAEFEIVPGAFSFVLPGRVLEAEAEDAAAAAV